MITVCTSSNVLLGFHPQPATIVINNTTGKITDIYDRCMARDSFPPHTRYIDAGSRYILPGLVEYVALQLSI